jgi:hypothetical protein
MFLVINLLDRLGLRYDRLRLGDRLRDLWLRLRDRLRDLWLRLRDRLRLGDDWNGVRGWWAVTSSHLY